MNRKIEDVKVGNRRISQVHPKNDVVLDDGNHNPTIINHNYTEAPSSKYDFLDKKAQKTNHSSQRMYQTPQISPKKRKLSKKIAFIFVLSVIAGFLYLLSTTFLSANVSVVVKNKTFDLKSQEFTANKNKTNGISFELMSVSDSEFKDVVLASSAEVSYKAKGEVTLFNEYSTKAQKITAGSFLSDENGKTYKTDATISIPGYVSDKTTKKITPGEISVSITAFLPGEAYNGDPKSFVINSFKGTDKYKKIYGKAKTSLSGGITGLIYMLDEGEKADLSTKVSTLKDKLLKKLNAQVPDGYIVYPESVIFTSDIQDSLTSKTPDAKLEMKGTLSAALLKESELTNAIVNKLLPDITVKEKLEIIPGDISALTFNYSNEGQIVDKDTSSFDFELTGQLPLKWNPYLDELKTSLSGKNKSEVLSIFKQDPGILSANVNIIPFWSKKLPIDTKNINIIVK